MLHYFMTYFHKQNIGFGNLTQIFQSKYNHVFMLVDVFSRICTIILDAPIRYFQN